MPLIMIIEDSFVTRTVLTDLLPMVQPDVRVIQATNGKEGVLTAIAEQPDLIMIDLVLPEYNGFQLARMLRAHEKTRHIPLIGMTGHAADESDNYQGLRQITDAFLLKPFYVDRLLAVMRELHVLAPAGHEAPLDPDD